jgi:hypothetical protein
MKTFRGYDLKEMLGEGGFGSVYASFSPSALPNLNYFIESCNVDAGSEGRGT